MNCLFDTAGKIQREKFVISRDKFILQTSVWIFLLDCTSQTVGGAQKGGWKKRRKDGWMDGALLAAQAHRLGSLWHHHARWLSPSEGDQILTSSDIPNYSTCSWFLQEPEIPFLQTAPVGWESAQWLAPLWLWNLSTSVERFVRNGEFVQWDVKSS